MYFVPYELIWIPFHQLHRESPCRKMGRFLWSFSLKMRWNMQNLCNCIHWNCGNLQKLQFDENREKKVIPQHPVLTKLLPWCKELFLMTSLSKHILGYITESARNSHLVLFQTLINTSNLQNIDESNKLYSLTKGICYNL